MEAELFDIRQHMGRFPPFDSISDALLDDVAGHIDVAYFRKDSDILVYDQPVDAFCYIRSGAVEVYRRNGQLYNRLGEGDIFGHFNLLRNRRVRFPAKAIEDTLIYFIPANIFDRLCDSDDHFADFVELERPRLQSTVEQQKKSNDMLVTRIRKLISTGPVIVDHKTPVQQAAQQMKSAQDSALLVIGPTGDNPRLTFQGKDRKLWQIQGILTNSDFRDRVVAEGLSPQTPVGDIISGALISIQADESIHDAMLVMLRNNVHHLPILHKQTPVGIVHLSDIIRYETHSSVYLVSNIFSQQSQQGLARLLPDVRAAFVRMVDDGADARMIGMAISTIGRAFTRRLLELAEQKLGPPPIPYCFMALGSMARNEQLIVTDQDNALVLDDSFDEQKHDDYFLQLADYVSNGLDACGYTFCSGGIMATNRQWRQPLKQWKACFREWITDPSPERLLHSAIFFDLDSVAGESDFVEQLQTLVASLAKDNRLFLAAMAHNALNRTPPLGFFRTFVVEKDGRESRGINLKRRGTAPMADLIRVHALACGSMAQNSHARLEDIGKTQLLAPGVAQKLHYAMEHLGMARIRHQADSLRHEKEPDNNIDPENVSDHERHNLKEAFQTLSLAQKFLKFRYPIPANALRNKH